MAQNCLLYYITSLAGFPGDERARRFRLLDKIEEAAVCGVDCIQLREKNLPARELESLAREAVSAISRVRVEKGRAGTVLLINSRTDVALAAAAAGVHLPAGDVSPADVRKAWKYAAEKCDRGTLRSQWAASNPIEPLIAVSCHSPQAVNEAAANQAKFAVFAPVFEKKDAPGTRLAGLDALHQACRASIPVFALGGVTLRNAESCLRAGASGIAAIRLFQENDIAPVVRDLRGD
jgi:thiamine-phosphate pyrophosphorylase